MLAPILLEDATADFYTSDKTKPSMHFHVSASDEFSVHFHGVVGPSFNTVYIVDSHKHVAFFEFLRSQYFPHANTHIWYKLTVRKLNALLEASRAQFPNLPTRFQAAMFRIGTSPCASFLPKDTLRSFTSRESPHRRLSCVFALGKEQEVFTQARRFEAKMCSDKVFPIELTNVPFHPDDVWCVALNPREFQAMADEIEAYLAKLIKDQEYRFPGQEQSRHIPRYHGRTGYGHHCVGLAKWLVKLAPFLGGGVVYTANLAWPKSHLVSHAE